MTFDVNKLFNNSKYFNFWDFQEQNVATHMFSKNICRLLKIFSYPDLVYTLWSAELQQTLFFRKIQLLSNSGFVSIDLFFKLCAEPLMIAS